MTKKTKTQPPPQPPREAVGPKEGGSFVTTTDEVKEKDNG